MKRLRQLAGILLLAVMAGYPAMACLTPGAEMTEAERDCCKQMAQQCGSMNMPASHSCCQKDISRPNPMLRASWAQLIAPAVCGTVASELPRPHVPAPEVAFSELHPPPESPPGTSSILRI